MFKITVKGKEYLYDSFEKAKHAATEIFRQTGIVVGIERA